MVLYMQEVPIDPHKVVHGQEIALFFHSGLKVSGVYAINGGITVFAEGCNSKPTAAFRFCVMRNNEPYPTLGVNTRYVGTVAFGLEAFHVYFLGEVNE